MKFFGVKEEDEICNENERDYASKIKSKGLCKGKNNKK